MKNLLLPIALFFCLSVNAQDTTWSKGMQYLSGSKTEKAHQDMIRQQSGNKFLCRIIGFKAFYEQNITSYLQLNREYALGNSNNGSAADVFLMTKKVYIGNQPKAIKLVFLHTKDDRVTSGKITGPFIELANLFLRYWPQDPLFDNEAQLKPGVAAIKHSYGDLISFKWNAGVPYITITKDENISMPVTASTL